MAAWLDYLLARVARLHAARVSRTFLRTLDDIRSAQDAALRVALAQVRGSAFARSLGLDRVRNRADLRSAAPIHAYEDLRPWIERVAAGEPNALLRRGGGVLMFAASSGTTSKRKLIPVTPAFVRDYRRGWNIFGLKMLTDHPRAVLRAILQSSGRWDESRSPAGIPIGAITGLLARTQKRIVRRHYVGRPELAEIPGAAARYYTLMRLGLDRDVAFAVTANPATLIRLAQVADENSEELIRDVHDGTLSERAVPAVDCPPAIRALLRANPTRAKELAALRSAAGGLRPRDYWRVEFVACWTGGSMRHYLPRVAEWWGPVPVRDVGLLASEGRVTIPLTDNTPVGVLDVSAGCFEFIRGRAAESRSPSLETVAPEDLEPGGEYVVVLTNTAGLVRYRLDDVVRVHGFLGQAPLLEFLHRAGRVASVAGEKLTENQVVAAWHDVASRFGLSDVEFMLGPIWTDPPSFRAVTSRELPEEVLQALDAALCAQNEEYASRRSSARLGAVSGIVRPSQAFQNFDRRQIERRGAIPEQYKRTVLFVEPGEEASLVTDSDIPN